MCVTARRGENMKKIITSAVLCAAMATAVSTFGVQPVSATYPLIDKNGNTVPVERDVDIDNKKLIGDNKKLSDRYRWYDQVDDYDLVETNIESTAQEFGYPIQVPSYMPKDYAVRDVKAKDHDVLEIVYTETGRDGEFGPKLTFSNTDIVYRMGWAIDTVVKNKELMNRYRWYDQLDNGDILERNIEATTNYFGYNLQIPSYMPEDYAVRDVKLRDHDVLEIVYTETGHNGEYGQKLTFSNTDIVYRMGWAIDTVVKPILEKTKYNADDVVSFTTPNGISVYTLGSRKDSIQIAYWEKDNKVYMLYFASTRNQNFVSKIVDSVGPVSNVAVDDTRLRGDRNDEQHIEEPVKQKVEIDWPPYETIGLPLRTHTNSVWPILTSKTIGLPSGVINASHKMSYDVSVPSYLPFGYTYYATHFYDNDVLETVYWKQGEEYQERSGRWVTHTMVFRMSYSMDTVWPEEYIPWEYHDVQWSDSTPIGEVQYTGDVDKGLVRSVTWYKDNMAYFLFFQVPVKASEADFYRNHVVPLKDIDPSRTDLIGVQT